VASIARRIDIKTAPRPALLLLSLALLAGTGCIVGQPPGEGRCLHLEEPKTGADYWLYLPDGYRDAPVSGDPDSKHPLVMTFHGMWPFDTERRQIREWQQEADRYGFVVCAPNLRVSALLSPLPLSNPENSKLKRDERDIIAIMDQLYRTVNVDPNRVLSTSWSYGGYVAHYMANRHPERFCCVAVRQSNFNPDLLDPRNVPRYRDRKIGIFFTEHDFGVCKRESRAAATWYAKNGFDLTYAIFEGKGHERTPGVAAEFFAQAIGVEPKSPPTELASMQVIPTPPPKSTATPEPPTAQFTGPIQPFGHPSDHAQTEERPPADQARSAEPLPWPVPEDATTRSAALRHRPINERRPPDRARPDPEPADRGPLHVRLSSTIGVTPLRVVYSAVLPSDLRRGSSALWLQDGEPIANGFSGQTVFTKPGEYELEVFVTTPEGQEYRAAGTITVIERASRGGQ
jgi:pimeloyl-ACP methyl ester carboxylesterase